VSRARVARGAARRGTPLLQRCCGALAAAAMEVSARPLAAAARCVDLRLRLRPLGVQP
jgi:hypothetical protein